jgi:hypothetical protein
MAPHGRTGLRRRLVYIAVAGVLCAAVGQVLLEPPAAQTPAGFAERIAAFSEPGGYFDTDNLISNEASYLQVLPELSQGRKPGGVYIGVGPDQNFSYIAALRPSLAFIVDIRRDNMLLHLLFKAIFELAGTRAEYLALLTGRPLAGDPKSGSLTPVQTLVERIDQVPPNERSTAAIRARVDAAIARSGVTLSPADRRTIDRFHRRFISSGLDLRFESAGRPPRSHYPTYRQLLLARDGAGQLRSFLASEESFQFLKRLQESDRIVPVVGDVSGERALASIGRSLAAGGERVSAFYVSNVEYYLFHSDAFPRFVDNLRQLPRTGDAVLIRSLFNQYAYMATGDSLGSASQLQPISELLARAERERIRTYADLVVPR